MTVASDDSPKEARGIPFLDQKSRKLANELLEPCLPFIQFNLGEIEQRAKHYLNTVPTSKDGNTKAHYLLAGSGINAEQTWKKIESLSLQVRPPTTLELSFTDVDMFLKYHREKNVLNSLEALVQNTQIAFDQYLEEEWRSKAAKSRPSFDNILLENKKRVSFYPFSVQRSQKFASTLKMCLEEEALHGFQSKLVSSFCEVAREFAHDTKSLLLYESWKLLSSVILDKDSVTVFGNKGIISKAFDIETEDGSVNSRFYQRISDCSRKFLEAQFFEVLNKEIAKTPQAALVGGVPSIRNKIRAYLNIRLLRNGVWINPDLEIIQDVPIWAFIFYLLRCGFLKEAVDFTEENRDLFEKVAEKFPFYINAYAKAPNGILPRQLRSQLFSEFNQTIRLQESSDPYKYAVYKIIGRCDLSKTSCPSICSVTEDYIWFQLILSREFTEKSVSAHEFFSLEDVQHILLSYGSDYFTNNGSNPVMYFFLLMLCGLYERAINFLYPYFPTDAVHFAITCAYYGLLRTAPSSSVVSNEPGKIQSMLVETKSGKPSLEFDRLLIDYTQTCQELSPVMSACYLIPMCKIDKYISMCHKSLCSLVLSTRDYVNLLGDIRGDGERTPSFLENHRSLIGLSSVKEYLSKITLTAAKQADDQGLLSDAILLYHLAEDYDAAVTVINRRLGSALLRFLDQFVFPDKLISLTKSMMDVYNRNPSLYAKVDYKNRETTNLLLLTVEAFNAYTNKDYEQALSSLQQLEILPLDPLDSDCETFVVRKLAKEFRFLNENLLQNVPGIVLIAMNSLKELYAKQKSSSFGNDAISVDKLRLYRQKARRIVMYSFLIEYRMPSQILEQLNRCEIEMT
ncbi:nucleoporin Nic96 homolog [Schizosaccharomyces pombe]|uniref:Meiotically up-regulated gene 87 protein n=1 Tax=Schizosaccharomyces pombe (strain 972 / ATCC 24843) TaxID=284812 RepID=MUG87_SCHPO|nr:nuclear pore complex component nup97 [Schizosaccharomyces pombe]O94418.1 RecName: Full=Meiotically up-regulated gene 87 protein [Schizosaccharomyces pombe 972h-]CAA22495.1 nucleoporin Nic96 homolog [Schizosaccharomyces pombe]|eukprot:NP_588469.1 nuclear pore complex component nup97 [Schizosaccharomyces pombe]